MEALLSSEAGALSQCFDQSGLILQLNVCNLFNLKPACKLEVVHMGEAVISSSLSAGEGGLEPVIITFSKH